MSGEILQRVARGNHHRMALGINRHKRRVASQAVIARRQELWVLVDLPLYAMKRRCQARGRGRQWVSPSYSMSYKRQLPSFETVTILAERDEVYRMQARKEWSEQAHKQASKPANVGAYLLLSALNLKSRTPLLWPLRIMALAP